MTGKPVEHPDTPRENWDGAAVTVHTPEGAIEIMGQSVPKPLDCGDGQACYCITVKTEGVRGNYDLTFENECSKDVRVQYTVWLFGEITKTTRVPAEGKKTSHENSMGLVRYDAHWA